METFLTSEMSGHVKDALQNLNTRKSTSRRILTGILSKNSENSNSKPNLSSKRLSATPHDGNSKTITVIIYLEGLFISSKQQFISNLRQIKTTSQSAL